MTWKSFQNVVQGLILGGVLCGLMTLLFWFVDRDASPIVNDTSSLEGIPDGDLGPGKPSVPSEGPVSITRISPLPASELSEFNRLRLWFSQPVEGAQSVSIEANGQLPVASSGQGGGPYDFWFPPMEKSNIEIVLKDENRVTDSSGERVSLDLSWRYGIGASPVEGNVRLADLRLRVPAEYRGADDLPKTWLSVENLSENPVETLGWQIRVGGAAGLGWSLPARSVPVGRKSLIELDGLTPIGGALETIGIPERGRLELFNADYPPKLLDAVDYEFTSGDPELGMTRSNTSWAFESSGGAAVIGHDGTTPRLPEKPVPDYPPGIYSRALDVSFSSLDPNDEIWYTIDGTTPWKNALRYEHPIRIDKGGVIKACVRRGGLTSRVATCSYQIGNGESVPNLPSLALSNAGFDQKETVGQLYLPPNGGALGASVEVWGSETSRVLGGHSLLSELGPTEGGLRFKGRGFRLRLIGASDRLDTMYRQLGLPPMSQGATIRCLPAFVTSRREAMDWMVDQMGLPHRPSPSEAFVNLVVNGKSMGPYRLTTERSQSRDVVKVDGAEVTVIGDGAEWKALMRWILDSNFVDSSHFKRLEARFDVSGFIDFYLMGLFWGDRTWPLRNQEVILDARTMQWAFLLTDLGEAGFLWSDDQFPSTHGRVSSVGLVFDSLIRSTEFRRRIERRYHVLFEQEKESLQARIDWFVRRLNRQFEKRFLPLGRKLDREAVANRLAKLREHLIKHGLIPTASVPEISLVKRSVNEVMVEADTASAELYFTKSDSDPVQWLDDVWLIPPGTEKRVLIPTSDRHFETWRRPDFVDQDWIRVKGLLGFDPKGLSGKRIVSEFHDLIYNRSTGVYLRIPFDVETGELATMDRLVLRCRINDGFVASINGKNFLRMNVPEVVRWNSVASQDLRGTGWKFREFNVSYLRDQLLEGRNVLGIHALNSMMNGPSFLVDVELVGRRDVRGEPKEAARRYEEPVLMESGDALMTFREREGDRWSRLSQVRPRAGLGTPAGLVIRRLHFEEPEAPGLEFFEVENLGLATIDCGRLWVSPLRLNGAEGALLEAGKSVSFVSESGLGAFRARWPGRRIGGVFQGALAAFSEMGLWYQSRRVDWINPAGIAKTFDDVPLRGGALVRHDSPTAEGLWERERLRGEANLTGEADRERGGQLVDENKEHEGKPEGSPPVRVRLNEVLISSDLLGEGWIELHNPDPRSQDLTEEFALQVNDFRWHPFKRNRIAPKGYLVTALPRGLVERSIGESDGQGLAIELLFKGRSMDRMLGVGGSGSRGSSFGRWPDGEGNAVEFQGTASPGRENYFSLVGGRGPGTLSLNEVMAHNRESYRGGGDWLELHNSTERVMSLEGMSVSVGEVAPGQWRFPKGSRVLPGGYLFLRCLGTEPPSVRFDSRMNLGRDLDERGDQVYVFDAQNRIVDQVVFGPQLVDQSIVRTAGGTWISSIQPSAGARNRGAKQRLRTPVMTLEVLGSGEQGLEVQLDNSTGEVARIDGWRLQGMRDGVLLGRYRFPNHSFIGKRQVMIIPWDLKYDSGVTGDVEVRMVNAEGRMIGRAVANRR